MDQNMPTPRSAASVADNAIVRWLLFGVAAAAFGYGAWLGVRKDSNGIAVAAAFAVAVLLLVVAIAGQVPASLKVGDVQLDMYAQGKSDGVVQGSKLAAKAAAGVDVKDLVQAADHSLPPGAPRGPALAAVEAAAQVVHDAAEANPAATKAMSEDILKRLAAV